MQLVLSVDTSRPVCNTGIMFYTYRQNNSGGQFSHIPDKLSQHVVVEASSAEEADQRFLALGGYFDGVSENRDCNCCGDRWYPCDDLFDGTEFPEYYGKSLAEAVDVWDWMGDDPTMYVHLLDGRVYPFHVVDGRFFYLDGDLSMEMLELGGPSRNAQN